ncbi:alpha/beta-hydrolase [Pterulicium gracile]|uniref:Alpha/beta-hydrolase n=1 Tax=Pterulicium gracile TaxID=1884261 RepID=A0A5C3QBQ8_9AGAR|nr:alpha/beta-hydrolase [Pterula gracilis]
MIDRSKDSLPPAQLTQTQPSDLNLRSALPAQSRTGIDPALYGDLVFYFQYASSAYSLLCLRPNGNHLVSHFTNASANTQGFVARDDGRKELVVAIRGSATLPDILLDSQILLVPFISPGAKLPKSARVHAGFLLAWDSVSLEVIALVKHQLTHYPDYTIVAVGHSLGGAVATLAAMCLEQSCKKRVKLFTYGAPRAGNEGFAAYVNARIGLDAFRVVNTNDGVPTIIPRSLGYHHHGVEYWIYNDTPSAENTTMCSADGEDPTCSASIPSRGVDLAHTAYFRIMVGTPYCL